MTHQEFIDFLVPYSQKAYALYGVFPSVTISQACWESAYGEYTGKAVVEDNNLFGIKWTGRYCPELTVTQGSKVGDGAGYYNHYESKGDSAIDHGWFLKNNSRYTDSGTFNAKTGKEQLKCIMDAGYAENAYYEGACNIIDTYNLTQYDTGGGGGSDDSSDKVEKAVQWAIDIANDDSHGYDQNNRWGNDYDCSSLIISAYEQADIKLKSNGASYTGNMKSVALNLGFKEITISDWNDTSQFKRGDIILNEEHHVCMYIGNGKIVQASINEKGTATGGQTGDQTGKEIYVRDYYIYSHGWDCVLRYGNGSSGGGDINENNYMEYFNKYFDEFDKLGEVYKKICETPFILKQFSVEQIELLKTLFFNDKCHIKHSFRKNKTVYGHDYCGNRLKVENKSYIIEDVKNNGFIKCNDNNTICYKIINPFYIYQTDEEKEETKQEIIDFLKQNVKTENDEEGGNEENDN